MKSRLVVVFSLALYMVGSLGAIGQDISSHPLKLIPDHQVARERFQSDLLTAHPSVALAFKARGVDTAEGRSEISVEREGDFFFIRIASKSEAELESPGDYVIRRDVKTSFVSDIKVILDEGGSRYILLRPKGQQTSMDIVVEGRKLYSAVRLNIPMYYLLARPLETIGDLAGTKVDWASVLSAPASKPE